MKKFLIILAVFSLFACPLFAAAEVKAETKTTASKITTLTKEMSQTNYPGVLVPGSMTGTNVYISDIALMTNSALFEYVNGTPVGLLAVNTGIGTFGVSISPCVIKSLNNINLNMPNGSFGLIYGTKLGDMPFGLGVIYGLKQNSFENQDLSGYNPPVDMSEKYNQYIALKSSIGLGSFDLGASLSFYNNYQRDSYFTGSNWNYDDVNNTTEWQLDVSGRVAISNDMTTAATISYVNGLRDWNGYLDDNDDYTDRYINNRLDFSAVIGKDIKATEALAVKMAAGLNIGGYTNGVRQYIDNLFPGDSYNRDGVAQGDRTQYGYWFIPLNVAIEAKLNETWTVNSGVQSTIVGFNNTNGMYNSSRLIGKEKITHLYEDTTLDINPGLDYAIGLTGKIGDLTMDLMLNPIMLLSGPHFISGVSTNMNSSIALSYNW